MRQLKDHWWALAVAALGLLITMGIRPMGLPDEGRYVGVAAAMWNSGDWVLPTLNGLPYFHKPPLFYWLAGLLVGADGGNPFIARLVPWMASVLALWAVSRLCRRHGGEQGLAMANWALLLLLSMPLWHLGAQFANLDMLVSACICVAICSLASHALSPSLGWRLLGFAFMGLGVMAKGLIGVVLPLLVLGIWLFWRQGWRGWLQLAWVPGWALTLAICLPWFLAMEHAHPGSLYYLIVVHHIQRFASDGGFNNVMPLWFYPVVLVIMGLPWTPLWLWRLLSTWGRRHDALQQLALVWLLAITAFFSLPASKLLGYILPVAPALALLAAPQLASWQAQRQHWLRYLPWSLVALGMACNLAMLVGIRLDDSKSTDALVAKMQQQWKPGDAMLFEDSFAFDLPLLMRAKQPIPVMLDEPMRPQSNDGWRRELVEAATFAPDAARKVLIPPEDWEHLRCAAPRTWIIANREGQQLIPERSTLLPLAESRELQLYLWDAAEHCTHAH